MWVALAGDGRGFGGVWVAVLMLLVPIHPKLNTSK